MGQPHRHRLQRGGPWVSQLRSVSIPCYAVDWISTTTGRVSRVRAYRDIHLSIDDTRHQKQGNGRRLIYFLSTRVYLWPCSRVHQPVIRARFQPWPSIPLKGLTLAMPCQSGTVFLRWLVHLQAVCAHCFSLRGLWTRELRKMPRAKLRLHSFPATARGLAASLTPEYARIRGFDDAGSHASPVALCRSRLVCSWACCTHFGRPRA